MDLCLLHLIQRKRLGPTFIVRGNVQERSRDNWVVWCLWEWVWVCKPLWKELSVFMLGERKESIQRLEGGTLSSRSSGIIIASVNTSATLVLSLQVYDGGEESDPTPTLGTGT